MSKPLQNFIKGTSLVPLTFFISYTQKIREFPRISLARYDESDVKTVLNHYVILYVPRFIIIVFYKMEKYSTQFLTYLFNEC